MTNNENSETPTEIAPVAPDLQTLVRRFGTYDKITPEAWRQWDEDNEIYQRWIRRKT